MLSATPAQPPTPWLQDFSIALSLILSRAHTHIHAASHILYMPAGLVVDVVACVRHEIWRNAPRPICGPKLCRFREDDCPADICVSAIEDKRKEEDNNVIIRKIIEDIMHY